VSALEILAVLLGLANILLIVRRSLWNYPFGIAMVSIYFFIFLDANLYSDMLLQIFFLCVQIYGWWHWVRGRDTQGALIVERASRGLMTGWIFGLAIATALWGWLMHSQTDAAFLWWDASIAMTSIAAQILMSRRYLENWLFWVFVNLLSIPLYAAKDLWLTAGLYGLNLCICLWGWREWVIVEQQQRAAQSADSASLSA
jgi:nicotinamide mononucleotide transporter